MLENGDGTRPAGACGGPRDGPCLASSDVPMSMVAAAPGPPAGSRAPTCFFQNSTPQYALSGLTGSSQPMDVTSTNFFTPCGGGATAKAGGLQASAKARSEARQRGAQALPTRAQSQEGQQAEARVVQTRRGWFRPAELEEARCGIQGLFTPVPLCSMVSHAPATTLAHPVSVEWAGALQPATLLPRPWAPSGTDAGSAAHRSQGPPAAAPQPPGSWCPRSPR